MKGIYEVQIDGDTRYRVRANSFGDAEKKACKVDASLPKYERRAKKDRHATAIELMVSDRSISK